MAQVKCLICGQSFDRDKEDYMKMGRRYAHRHCFDTLPVAEQEQYLAPDRLYQYIKKLFNFSAVPTAVFFAAEQSVKSKGMTYDGLYNAFKYAYEVLKKQKPMNNNVFGIIPYVYEEAQKYYSQKDTTRKENIAKVEELRNNLDEEKIVVRIKPQKRQPMRNERDLFSFLNKED